MKQFITYFKTILFGIGCFVVLQSCKDNEAERLFPGVPSVRVAKQIKKVRELLRASTEGWRVTYFTDDTKLGGYTYLFKFTDDKNVEMASDFGTDNEKTTSEYNVILGSTVKLSFATESKIANELSSSDKYPFNELRGKGYKGDFEFLYYGQEGEDLIFRTNRDFIKLRFKKATADDWTDLVAKYTDSQAAIAGYPLVYQIDTKEYTFSYNKSLRFAENIGSNKKTSLNFGVGFTSTGIITSPAINVDSKKYSEFTFSSDKRKLVSSDGKFTIYILSPPFNMAQDWHIQANATDVSPSFLTVFNEVKDANARTYSGERLEEEIFIGNTTVHGRTSLGILLHSTSSSTNWYPVQYLLSFGSVVGQSDELSISKSGDGANNWKWYKHLAPMVDFIANNGPYRTELTPPVNPTEVRLTSIKNPDAWFIIRK